MNKTRILIASLIAGAIAVHYSHWTGIAQSSAEEVTQNTGASDDNGAKQAADIVASLDLHDAAKEKRVDDILTHQFKAIKDWHALYDDSVKVLTTQPDEIRNPPPPKQPEVYPYQPPAAAASRPARKAPSAMTDDEATSQPAAPAPKVDPMLILGRQVAASKALLHDVFIARLSAELTQDQVEMVKEKMTGGVMTADYQKYLTGQPNLSDANKAEIMKDLKAAREEALDQKSAADQAAAFKAGTDKILGYDVMQAVRK